MDVTPDRRTVLAALAAVLGTRPASAEEVVDLAWEDLLPEAADPVPNAPRGRLAHEDADLAARQPMSTGVRTDWNGRTVRMNGFIVPVDISGTGVTAFILVPYVGACVHVPPPPANQLVFVTTARPWTSDGLFEPVTVTGMFGTASTSTQLADIGYALSADRIRRYQD